MALYDVSFRRSAEKDLRKLDGAKKRRVLKAVENLSRRPRPVAASFRATKGALSAHGVICCLV